MQQTNQVLHEWVFLKVELEGIFASSLEESNVDMAAQFVEMIKTQRGFKQTLDQLLRRIQ